MIDWGYMYAYCLGGASMLIVVLIAIRFNNDDDDPHCPA